MTNWLQPRKVLSDRQLSKVKTSMALLGLVLTVQGCVVAATYMYEGEEYEKTQTKLFPRGQIVEYTNGEGFCDSFIFVPGVTVLSKPFLIIVYMLCLFWFFLGMNIVADIFMESIEVITSSKRVVMQQDPYTHEFVKVKVPVWNPTVANLTLMALGSSAPEILLNVLETVQTLGSKPGELGPSTIVGSAAFNFLVISGVSIYAVNESNDNRSKAELDADGVPKGVKKVQDTGVFAITTCWSIIAYIWLYVVLLDGIVKPYEAYLTLGFFFVLIIMAFIADKCRQGTLKKRMDDQYGETADNKAITGSKSDLGDVQTLSAVDFYNRLIPVERGDKIKPDEAKEIANMKEYLMVNFGTTKVSEIPAHLLKDKLEGPALIERISHRKAVSVNFKREAVAKYAVLRRENMSADSLKDHQKNPNFGFACLHYSVSEAAKKIKIKVINKSKKAGEVQVRTVDGDAQAGDDYEAVDSNIQFKSGQTEGVVEVNIFDDEDWEPDEDFFVELYDTKSGNRLMGEDTRTRVTILDDDKPGMLVFEEKQTVKHPANETDCIVTVNRVQGTDGKIKVKYRTVTMGSGDQSAKPGIDYEETSGELEFLHMESKKEIIIPILQKEGDQERDEMFGVKLYDAWPAAVKVSKKDQLVIEIVTDAERKKQAEALTQLMERINREENVTWGQQFLNATKLHPSKNEDGEIEDISAMDAIIHFFSIGWKVLFALCPPPHWGRGKPCFIAAICFVGALTAVVAELAGSMGCVMGLKPGVTAITFVAIGTSLPDTFASMKAATDSPNADSAVGNITGSNSVNVFLGLGLPWVIAVIYSGDEDYLVPSKGLDLSVVLFLSCCLVGIGILIFRRCTVKGELGGSQSGRIVSAIIFVSLWLIYIVFSTMGQYDIISIS